MNHLRRRNNAFVGKHDNCPVLIDTLYPIYVVSTNKWFAHIIITSYLIVIIVLFQGKIFTSINIELYYNDITQILFKVILVTYLDNVSIFRSNMRWVEFNWFSNICHR